MRIKIRASLAGNGMAYSVGDVVDWDDKDAMRLIQAGYATKLGSETTAVAPGENAARPPGRPRKTGVAAT